MSELFCLRPSLYNPFDICRCCGKQTRVWLVEHLREERFCHDCLGINWGTRPEPRQVAELAQSFQRHEVMNFLETWRPYHVTKEGRHTPISGNE